MDALRQKKESEKMNGVQIKHKEAKDPNCSNIGRKLFVFYCAALFFILTAQQSVYAASVYVEDYCQWAVEKVLLPATYDDLVSCNNDWRNSGDTTLN